MAIQSFSWRYTVLVLLVLFGLLWYVNVNDDLNRKTTHFKVPDRKVLLEVLRKLGETGQVSEFQNQLAKEIHIKETNLTTSAVSEQIKSKNNDKDLPQRIKKRVEHVLGVCKEHGYQNSSFVNRYYDIGHMIVDDKHKFIYCYVPKVACTTWKTILHSIYFISGRFGKRLMYNLSPDEFQRKMNTYKKAMFVRDPITRLLSLYLSKFRGDNFKVIHSWEFEYGQDIARRYRNNSLAQNYNYKFNLSITFNEFINFVIDLGPHYEIDPYQDHFLPMYRSCDPCRFKPEFIGRFEELALEGPYMLKWLGVNGIAKFPVIHESNAAIKLRQEYSKIDPTFIKKLRQYYSRDYELFGYSLDDTFRKMQVGLE
ncbi:carbohydrate sulfotransferase 14-like isoform X2 [Anneissia japonica]|uniref:carbohydrate sulfotransferase 14-like isoform X2 n=1 Tax=Anneissia japonica TaxID=1529436 RepID=UPI001425BB86|nr:carbohydrate sulfotransferase 14-like isoform X2 [Anneissia japonica]